MSGRDYYAASENLEFSKVGSAPRGMGVAASQTHIWLSLDATITGHIAAEVVDDEPELRLHLSKLDLMACPVTSHAGSVCDPLWPELAARMPLESVADTGYASSLKAKLGAS